MKARSRFAFLSGVRDDLKYVLRLFARQPAILFLAVLGLSLGLGISTAAFSVMNTALRGEGLVDADRVPGVLRTTDRSVSTSWSYDEFQRLREGATLMHGEAVLTDSAAVRMESGSAEAPSVNVAFVSGGFFAAVGAQAILGRLLAATDEHSSGPAPAVVGFAFWTSMLNRDPAPLGRTIRIGRTDATIVGVAAQDFSLPGHRQLWVPMTAYGPVYGATSGRRVPDVAVEVFGHLLPEAAPAQAEAQLSGVAAGLGQGSGEPTLHVKLDPRAGLGRTSSSDVLGIAVFVFAVIVLVLLLACSNVASVLMATAITREREIGVRAALGAGRWRIVRQLVTESLSLGALAAVLGLVSAYWALPTIGAMIEAPPAPTLLRMFGSTFFSA